MGRTEIRASVTVDRPAEEVFDYLVDVTKHAEWSPKPYRVEGVTGPVSVGTTYDSYGWLPGDKDHHNDVAVTVLERPQRLVLTATEKGGEQFVSTFTLTQRGNVTDLERVLDVPKPGGVAGLLFPVLVPTLIRPDVAKGLSKLKQRVEAG
jgi:uncharacterized protein YndB with AHSA1/START domain